MKVPQTFECVKMDKKRGNIVLSRSAIMEKIRDKSRSELISKLKEGDVVQGVVKSIVDWGVFVDLAGVDSLLHITDISWSRINKPSELLSIGQQIKVKITTNISPSIRSKIPPCTGKIFPVSLTFSILLK